MRAVMRESHQYCHYAKRIISDCQLALQNPTEYLCEMVKDKMGMPEHSTWHWGEFCHLWRHAIHAAEDSEQLLLLAFKFFDEDGSGCITRAEMAQQFAELGGLLSAQEVDLFHDILDADGNGMIDVRSITQLAMALVMRFSTPTARLWPHGIEWVNVNVCALTLREAAGLSCDACSQAFHQPALISPATRVQTQCQCQSGAVCSSKSSWMRYCPMLEP